MQALGKRTNRERLLGCFAAAGVLMLGGCAETPHQEWHYTPDPERVAIFVRNLVNVAQENAKAEVADAKLKQQALFADAVCTNAPEKHNEMKCASTLRLFYETYKSTDFSANPSYDALYKSGEIVSTYKGPNTIICEISDSVLSCYQYAPGETHPQKPATVVATAKPPKVTTASAAPPPAAVVEPAPQEASAAAAPTTTQTAAATPAQPPAASPEAANTPEQKPHIRTVVSQFAKVAVKATFASFDSALCAFVSACFLLGGLWAAAFRSRRKEPVRKFREAPPMFRAVPTPIVAPAVTVPAPVAPASSNVVYADFGKAAKQNTAVWTNNSGAQLGTATRAAMKLYGNAPTLKAA